MGKGREGGGKVAETASSLSTYFLCELEIRENKPNIVVSLPQGWRVRKGKMRVGRPPPSPPAGHLLTGPSSDLENPPGLEQKKKIL